MDQQTDLKEVLLELKPEVVDEHLLEQPSKNEDIKFIKYTFWHLFLLAFFTEDQTCCSKFITFIRRAWRIVALTLVRSAGQAGELYLANLIITQEADEQSVIIPYILYAFLTLFDLVLYCVSETYALDQFQKGVKTWTHFLMQRFDQANYKWKMDNPPHKHRPQIESLLWRFKTMIWFISDTTGRAVDIIGSTVQLLIVMPSIALLLIFILALVYALILPRLGRKLAELTKKKHKGNSKIENKLEKDFDRHQNHIINPILPDADVTEDVYQFHVENSVNAKTYNKMYLLSDSAPTIAILIVIIIAVLLKKYSSAILIFLAYKALVNGCFQVVRFIRENERVDDESKVILKMINTAKPAKQALHIPLNWGQQIVFHHVNYTPPAEKCPKKGKKKSKIPPNLVITDETRFEISSNTLLLNGDSGNGKSTTINFFAGETDLAYCQLEIIEGQDYVSIPDGFRSFLHSRLYIGSDASLDNNKTWRELFEPFDETNFRLLIELVEMTEVLSRYGEEKEDLEDCFEENEDSDDEEEEAKDIYDKKIGKLSSGEQIRVILASNLYALKTTDHVKMLIMDEADKNLQADLAVRIIRKIREFFPGFMIVTFHHEACKQQMRKMEKCQEWQYDKMIGNKIQMRKIHRL